jgi:LacI family transcriptional regulator
MVFLFSAPSSDYNLVTTDPTECSIKLMEMFIQAGHRRIGYISQDFPNIRLHSSHVAYQKVLASHKIPYDESLVYFGTSDYESGPQAWRQWRSNPRRPTAVLCFNDITACGLIQSAQNDGYRVPHDLSVAGSDDIPTASFLNLTTIRTNPADIAREVFSLLEHPANQPPETRLVPATIVERSSIGPVPSNPK